MDHAVDLIGNGLCEFIIVPGVVSIDRDIHTAKVGRPGRTAPARAACGKVPARAIEMRQGQFRQTERADAVVRKPSESMQGKRKMSGGKSAHSFYPAPGIYHLQDSSLFGRTFCKGLLFSDGVILIRKNIRAGITFR